MSNIRLEKEIFHLLKKKDKDYLPVKQVVAGISNELRKNLGLRGKIVAKDAIKKFTPFLGNKLMTYQGGRYYYIGYTYSLEEILLNKLRQKPGISTKKLGQNLPMSKKLYLNTLNILLEKRKILCIVKEKDYATVLQVSIENQQKETKEEGNKKEEFKQAYQSVGNDRSFVMIHHLRDHLQWSKENFDQTLTELWQTSEIDLHGGNPTEMSQEEIQNSFVDENGTLYIDISWRNQNDGA